MLEVFSTNVIDINGVSASFDELIELQESKEIKNALREAGKYIVRQGKSRLRSRLIMKRSDRTGLLLKSISYSVRKKNAGVIVGFKRNNKHASLSWIIDKGTDSRYLKSNDAYRGAVRPTYFWSETRDSDVPTAQERVMNVINAEIEKIKSRKMMTKYATGGII